MRQIKFRAWDKRQHEMFDIEQLAFDPWGKLVSIYCDGPEFSDDEEVLMGASPDLNQVALMQYTGLEDAGGKEIYDGDILQDEDEDIWSVEFEEDEAAFLATSHDGGTPTFIEMSDLAASAYVIGNIYENPELLEVHDETTND